MFNLKFDLHCHTKEGSPDGHVPFEDMVKLLKEKGYAGCLCTDHDSYGGYYHYLKEKDNMDLPEDFVVLKGVEYSTGNAGHFIVIMPDGVDSEFLTVKGMSAVSLEHEVHKLGGILGVAHPYMPGGWSFCNTWFGRDNKDFLREVDFIETYNSTNNPMLNVQAELLAARFKKLVTGGSDAHVHKDVGHGSTSFADVTISCNNDLIAYIKEGKKTLAGGEITDKMLKRRNLIVQKVMDATYFVANWFGAKRFDKKMNKYNKKNKDIKDIEEIDGGFDMSNKEVWVIGHKVPDTDSICSAIAYANLKNKLGSGNYIAKAAGHPTDETKFVLDYWKVEAPSCVESIEEGEVVRELALVDHNEPTQIVNGYEKAEIIEIVDHHRLGGLVTASPLYMRVQPVGCTSTILYNLYKEANVEIEVAYAGIMMSAIISDTLLFRSPTCTEADKEAAISLAEIAGVEDIDAYGKEMFKAGSNLADKSPEEIFFMDFKEFELNGKKVGIGQVSTINSEEIDDIHAKISSIMDKVLVENGLTVAFLMITDIMEESSKVVFGGENAITIIEEAFDKKTEGNSVYLPGVVSRKKQMVPNITKAMQA